MIKLSAILESQNPTDLVNIVEWDGSVATLAVHDAKLLFGSRDVCEYMNKGNYIFLEKPLRGEVL